MSFDIDVERRLGDRIVATRFSSNAGLTALFGRSGAGKTSILNMIAGLLRPDRGSIRVGGETLFGGGVDVPAHRRRAGYIFQDGRLFPHLSVARNLAFGRRFARPGDRLVGFDETVALLGLEPLLARWPRTLSGGEVQRVAIGRTLLSGARFLLMDEPLASLDGARREEVMRAIERIRDELALPILYVSHDPAEVERLAGAVIPIAAE